VMNQEANTPNTGFHRVCPVTSPMPTNEPTLTCVVLTGSPWKLAVVTRNAVERFAAPTDGVGDHGRQPVCLRRLE
jgi:hypothetical protein